MTAVTDTTLQVASASPVRRSSWAHMGSAWVAWKLAAVVPAHAHKRQRGDVTSGCHGQAWLAWHAAPSWLPVRQAMPLGDLLAGRLTSDIHLNGERLGGGGHRGGGGVAAAGSGGTRGCKVGGIAGAGVLLAGEVVALRCQNAVAGWRVQTAVHWQPGQEPKQMPPPAVRKLGSLAANIAARVHLMHYSCAGHPAVSCTHVATPCDTLLTP